AAVQATLESNVKVAKENFDAINKRIGELHAAAQELAAKRTEYRQKQEEERTVRDQLQKSQDEFDRLALFIEQNNWSTAEMAAQPDMPERPSFPRLPITLSLAIGLGLVLSIGIAFLRELLDTTVRSPRDVAKVGQLN